MKFYNPITAEYLKSGMKIHNGDNQVLTVEKVTNDVPGSINVTFKNMIGMHVYNRGDFVYVDIK